MNKELVKRDLWDSFRDLNTFPSFFGTRNLSRVFDSDISRIINGKCDIEETDDKYIVELEVPGVKKEEINLSLKNDTLTISWSRKKENKKSDGKSKYERSEGSFTRSFDVEGANTENVEAELKNGVLKIIVNKLEDSKPKNITIN
jgi:HSP20 family protein